MTAPIRAIARRAAAIGGRAHAQTRTATAAAANLSVQCMGGTPATLNTSRGHAIFSGSGRTGGTQKQQKPHSTMSASAANAAVQVQGEVERWEVNLTGADEGRLHGPRGDWWWTGPRPDELLEPGSRHLHSLAQPTLETVTDAGVKRYFDNTWTLTELLFSSLQGEEAFYRPPYHHLRHPMIFYYGHTATFYTNKLRVAGLLDSGINPYFEDIFEVGVDEMRWDDMSKNAMQWPTVGEVHEYRAEVYKLVNQVVDEHLDKKAPKRVGPAHPLWSLFMAFEHDRIHLETSSVLLRELPLELLRKPELWPAMHESAFSGAGPQSDPEAGKHFPRNDLVQVAGQRGVRIGKESDQASYGWDNEYGSRTVDVGGFGASKFMVSNGEYFAFVRDGGYREPKWWSEDGWAWRSFRNAKWPFFWSQAGPAGSHQYKLRGVFEEVEMPWSWPVNVNKHEATAFCNWKAARDGRPGLRLVTEAEHMLMRDAPQRHPVLDSSADPALTHGGRDIGGAAGVNLNLANGSETPVDLFKPNAQGFHDVTGNAWEWAEDDFNPLDGFAVHEYYDDFSTPCFDGEHNMILGGSFISSGDAGANLHCRYHFRPHFLQHSGFRYVQPARREAFPGEGVATKLGGGSARASSSSTSAGNPAQAQAGPTAGPTAGQLTYESEHLVNQYLALHFGQQPEVANETIRQHTERPNAALNFPQRCADLLHKMAVQHGAPTGSAARALDLGCAVGGSSFALARHFGAVTGIDFSHAFVDAARAIRDSPEKAITFSVPVEGAMRRENIVARLDRDVDYSHVRFEQGDACALPPAASIGGPFDAVLMANLLCRLPDPAHALAGLRDIVNPGGVVLTVSPFSWLDEFTAKDKWLQQGAKPSADVLRDVMRQHGFRQVFEADMPLMIREHERKYQYIVSSAAAFVRQ